jgi:hypothetical protein
VLAVLAEEKGPVPFLRGQVVAVWACPWSPEPRSDSCPFNRSGRHLVPVDFWSESNTAAAMLLGVSMAPTPWSPHINVFATGGTIVARQPVSVAMCCDVTGWSHMKVFMAGATTSGLSKSQARATDV